MNETQESAIADFLQILEEHRKNCEAQGKYVEAEVAKKRFEELKSHEENRKRESMKAQQVKERLGVEEAHMVWYYMMIIYCLFMFNSPYYISPLLSLIATPP